MITTRLLLAMVILTFLFCAVCADVTANTTITAVFVTPTYHYSSGGGHYLSSTSTPQAEPTTIPTVVPTTTFKEQVYVNPVLTTFPPTIQTTSPVITMEVPSEVQGSIWDLWWLWVLLIIIVVVIVVWYLTR